MIDFLAVCIGIGVLVCILCAIAEGIERFDEWRQMRLLNVDVAPVPDERSSIEQFRRIHSH